MEAPPKDAATSRKDVLSAKQSRPHRPRPSLSGLLPTSFSSRASKKVSDAGSSQPRRPAPARSQEAAESWDDDFASDITLPGAYGSSA